MSKKEELRKKVDDLAETLAWLDDCDDWSTWIVYLCEALETEAFHMSYKNHPKEVESALESVRDAIDDRLQQGRW